jgi:DNA-binding response OmpR family regulator
LADFQVLCFFALHESVKKEIPPKTEAVQRFEKEIGMYHLLIADDEERIRTALRKYAEFEGWQVTEACDGMQAVSLARDNTFDIIILDIMMPNLDGFSACKEIRKTSDVPVLMLSARGEEYDKLFGFELGIDDYVVKPFGGKELMARIKAIIQRYRKYREPATEETLLIGGLSIDFKARRVFVDGVQVSLTPKEYDLLFFFARNPNTAFTRDQLLNKIWGYDYYGDERTVDAYIKLLRGNLGSYRNLIVTLRGMGYRFETEI